MNNNKQNTVMKIIMIILEKKLYQIKHHLEIIIQNKNKFKMKLILNNIHLIIIKNNMKKSIKM